jgi:hypothetical protein
MTTCEYCNGTGVLDICPYCKGKGEYVCNRCNGNKSINSSLLGTLSCGACNGTGTKFCEDCWGKGVVQPYKCPYCT